MQCVSVVLKLIFVQIWLLFSIMVRQALRLGYHRDPKHIPHISVFDGEMRRRAWFLIQQFDGLTAFQLGIPCNLQADDESDTLLPQSLNDSDFDENSVQLPPARSDNDPTLILFFLAKAALMAIQKKVLHHQFTSRPVSYENDVLRWDAELEEIHAKTPVVLKIKPMSQSFSDPAFLIMYRFQCDVIYQKVKCVLHRNFITSKTRRQYSVDRCTQAGMQILRHQETIYSESKPHGQLAQDHWYFKSLHLSNCLLAAVVLCQVVMLTEDCNPDTKDEIVRLLRITLNMTAELKGESREAVRFNAALELILKKIDPNFEPDTLQSPSSNGATSQLDAPATPAFSLEAVPASDLEVFFNGLEDIDWVRSSKSIVNLLMELVDYDRPGVARSSTES